MKRFTAILTAFLTFLLISINSLSVYAVLPPELPQFRYSAYNLTSGNPNRVFAHVILYNSSVNQYRSLSFVTQSNYLSLDYLSLVRDSSDSCYLLASQDHLSSDTIIFFTNGTNGVLNEKALVNFEYAMSRRKTNTEIFSYYDSSALSNSINTSVSSGLWEICLSTVNIKLGDDIIFQGSQSAFYNACVPYNDEYITYPELTTPVEPPTEAPTIGEGDYDGDSAETSKNILDNVKQILTNIANLPKNIANAIYNFFSDLLSGILTGLDNLKDGIIQGLKDLFIPSDNAFTDIVDMVKTKFAFAYEFVDIAKTILVFSFDDDVEAPNFEISDSSGKWFKGSLNFIDWTIYEPYRPYVHALILAISWYQFIERTIKRLPSIIGGI